MTQAIDIIKGALRRVNSYQSGEPIAPLDAQDCLDTFNDLLDSLSTDHNSVVGSIENIFNYTPGQAQYTVGNPTCIELGGQPFSGTLTANSAYITGITNVPSNLVVGATVNDTQGLIPPGQTVTAIGATSVSFGPGFASANSVASDLITYTVPGDFAIPRPLSITHGFTRFNQLDFTIEVTMSQSRFLEILYKAQPGPWPIVAWYNPQMPYGLLNFYQTPGNAAELHLFTDNILGNLSLYSNFFMPQGYTRWMKWLLAKEICAEFGYPMTESIRVNAADAEGKIKALNAKPAVVARYDRMLTRGSRPDGGWILTGGYR